MGHLGVNGQMVFKGCEEFVNQSQKQVNSKQKSISKISRIGCKLPVVKKSEYFKFNSKVNFTTQRQALTRMGASEVGSIFTHKDSALELITSRV